MESLDIPSKKRRRRGWYVFNARRVQVREINGTFVYKAHQSLRGYKRDTSGRDSWVECREDGCSKDAFNDERNTRPFVSR